MAEYIEREAVLKHKRKMSGADFGGEFWDEAVLCEDIRKIPTADVVPVVRCKDCVFWDTESKGFSDEHICKMHSIVAVHSRYTNPTDYCSYGERRCEDAD